MKKFLFALAICALGVTCSIAQNALPRWGAGPPSQDNTGRVLTYVYSAKTYTSTLTLKPNAYQTIVATSSLTGAMTINATVTSCYAGDRLTIVLQADTLTAGRVVTLGGNFLYKSSGSTITVAANKSAVIEFIFDPKKLKFSEVYRTVQ